MVAKLKIAERVVEGRRLGRHVEHDERSRGYAFLAGAPGTRDDVLHRRRGRIFDQDDLGSCTGNALAGALNTEPLYRPRHVYREPMAVRLYSLGSHLDEFDGGWPPDDTGSSGLAVCKAGAQLGLLTGYRHAFGIEQALDALQEGAVITGVDWYEGFDRPRADDGLVGIAGQVRGGHEFLVRGYRHDEDPARALVLADNSWGPGWGDGGSFAFSVATWARLLEAMGDVTVPERA